MKAHKCPRKGHTAILALISKKQSEEQRPEDIPIVRDFPEVFPEDIPGLPPPRQVKFRITPTHEQRPFARYQIVLHPQGCRSYQINFRISGIKVLSVLSSR